VTQNPFISYPNRYTTISPDHEAAFNKFITGVINHQANRLTDKCLRQLDRNRMIQLSDLNPSTIQKSARRLTKLGSLLLRGHFRTISNSSIATSFCRPFGWTKKAIFGHKRFNRSVTNTLIEAELKWMEGFIKHPEERNG
jgi:hypothetical protein